jgi:hypothetical protein
MRRNNDNTRAKRIQEAVSDALADYGQPVTIYRAGVLVGETIGVADATAFSRLHETDLATYRFLYRIYAPVTADIRVNDTLLTNALSFLVRDIDLGTSQHRVATCLCERLASGP